MCIHYFTELHSESSCKGDSTHHGRRNDKGSQLRWEMDASRASEHRFRVRGPDPEKGSAPDCQCRLSQELW